MKGTLLYFEEFIAGAAVLVAVTLAIFFTNPQVTHALPLFDPFGGFIVSTPLPNFVPTPAGPIPHPVCPIYVEVTNNDSSNGLPPSFGIFIPVENPAPTYDYNNLFMPGTPIVGGLEPIPCVGGDAPIPLFPLFYDAVDGPFYLAGEGGIPGTY